MTSTDPVTTVIETVAAIDGGEVTALPPLHNYIDPEIVITVTTQDTAGDCQVAFQFVDHHIRVTQDGQVFVDGERREPDNIVN